MRKFPSRFPKKFWQVTIDALDALCYIACFHGRSERGKEFRAYLVGLFTSKDWVYTDGRKPLLMSAGPQCWTSAEMGLRGTG